MKLYILHINTLENKILLMTLLDYVSSYKTFFNMIKNRNKEKQTS